jgi:ribosomal protein L37AE/L43A
MLKAIKNSEGHYVCPTCGKTETVRTTMFYHMKKHAGEFNYTCTVDGCGRSFLQKSGLDQHVAQVHATAAPAFACPCCEQSFRTKSNRTIHICRAHGWVSAPVTAADKSGACACVRCNKQFASPTAYYYHAYACFDVPATIMGKG